MLARVFLIGSVLFVGAAPVPGAAPVVSRPGGGRGVPGVPGIAPSRKDGFTAQGKYAPGELQPGELSRMRDTMRRAYCEGGAHAEASPCKLQVFLSKMKARAGPSWRARPCQSRRQTSGLVS